MMSQILYTTENQRAPVGAKVTSRKKTFLLAGRSHVILSENSSRWSTDQPWRTPTLTGKRRQRLNNLTTHVRMLNYFYFCTLYFYISHWQFRWSYGGTWCLEENWRRYSISASALASGEDLRITWLNLNFIRGYAQHFLKKVYFLGEFPYFYFKSTPNISFLFPILVIFTLFLILDTQQQW